MVYIMFVIGMYIVAILIFVVVWALIRRRKKPTSTWDLKKQFAELEEQQRKLCT